jgi:hypothetical protein
MPSNQAFDRLRPNGFEGGKNVTVNLQMKRTPFGLSLSKPSSQHPDAVEPSLRQAQAERVHAQSKPQ